MCPNMKYQLFLLVIAFSFTQAYVIGGQLPSGEYTDRVLINRTQTLVRSFNNATYIYIRLEAPEQFNATFYIGDTMVENNIVDWCNITYVCYFEYSETYLPIRGHFAVSIDVETKIEYHYILEQKYKENIGKFYAPIVVIGSLVCVFACAVFILITIEKFRDKARNGNAKRR